MNEENNLEIPTTAVPTGQIPRVVSTPDGAMSQSEMGSSEEIIEEGDIVIEEDFEINLNVAEVSDTIDIDESTSLETTQNDQQSQLGTEQTGNITF